MKKNLLLCAPLLFFTLNAILAVMTASAYVSTYSAPAFSTDTTDVYLYFQGPNGVTGSTDGLYKIRYDSDEIVVASDDPLVNPVTWSDSDVTAIAATQLGAGGGFFSGGATVASTPSVPGDGHVYFQESNDDLAKIKTDGTGFFDFGVTTAYAPVASGGKVYFFSTYGSMIQIPTLYSIPTTSTGWPNGRVNLGAFGYSPVCIGGDGNLYFEGTWNSTSDHVLQHVPTTGVTPGQATIFRDNNSTPLETSCTPAVSGGAVYFRRRSDNVLCHIATGGTGFLISSNAIATTPYVGTDGALYFLDTSNEMYQADLSTGTTTDLYIQAASTPTSRSNGDGTITLYFQGTYNGIPNVLMKFTPRSL